MEFLFLSQEETIEAGVLDMSGCMASLEKMFLLINKGDFIMPGPGQCSHGARLFFPPEPRGPRMPVYGPARRFMALAGYLGGEFHIAGEKWYGSNIENPRLRNLPRSILMVVLNDPDTCLPLCIMDGTLESAMRTGAVIGLGAKYSCRPGADTAGLVGTGAINRSCLMALAVGMPNLKKVKVFDVNPERAQSFADSMGAELGLDIVPVDSLEAAVADSDAVSSATAGKNRPNYKKAWFKPGAYFGVSDDIVSDSELWLESRVLTDYWPMHMEWRDDKARLTLDIDWNPLHWPLHQLIMNGRMRDEDITNFGDVVAEGPQGHEDGLTVLASGGMVQEDLAWGYTVYQKALEKKIGQQIKLWDKPHWV